MSLFLPGQPTPLDPSMPPNHLVDCILANDVVRHSAHDYLSRSPVAFCTPSPEISPPSSSNYSPPLGSLHVFQREYILASNADLQHVSHIGSNEATTCVIVSLWTPQQTYLVHLDGGGEDGSQLAAEFPDSFRDFACNEKGGDEMIHVHLVGGYVEPSGLSRQIVEGVVAQLANDSQRRRFLIRTFVVDSLNTMPAHESGNVDRPRMTNLCMCVRTGEAAPSIYPRFLDLVGQGPDYILRGIRMSVASSGANSLFRIRACPTDRIVIPRICFRRSAHPSRLISLLQVPDERLLKFCSTSPDVESETFVPLLKVGWRFQIQFADDVAFYRDGDDIDGGGGGERTVASVVAQRRRVFQWKRRDDDGRWAWVLVLDEDDDGE